MSNTLTDKTYNNGLGGNETMAYPGERIFYSFKASELVPTDATKALLDYNPNGDDPPSIHCANIPVLFSDFANTTQYDVTTRSISNGGNTDIGDCVMTYTIPSSNPPVGVPYINFVLQDRAMNRQGYSNMATGTPPAAQSAGIIPIMNISSNIGGSGNITSDSAIELIFTLPDLSRKTNNFELSDTTYSSGTLSNFITVFKVTVENVTYLGNKYFINGIQQEYILLKSGNTYRFDQSDSTMAQRPSIKIFNNIRWCTC